MLSKLDPPFLEGETVVLRSSVRRWLDKNILIYGSGHTWQLIYISMRGPLSDIRTKALPRLLATTLFACVVSNYPTRLTDAEWGPHHFYRSETCFSSRLLYQASRFDTSQHHRDFSN